MTHDTQQTIKPRSGGARGRSEDTRALLATALQVAVPLRIHELRDWPADARVALARLQADQTAAHGDDLQFGGKHCVTTFNSLAVALAAAAYQPGGVTLFGCRWDATDPDQSCSIVDP